MPDDVAEEKVKALQSLGAEVRRVRPASIVDKKQVRTCMPHRPSDARVDRSRAVCRMYAPFSRSMSSQRRVRTWRDRLPSDLANRAP